jgi:hypothetical protein
MTSYFAKRNEPCRRSTPVAADGVRGSRVATAPAEAHSRVAMGGRHDTMLVVVFSAVTASTAFRLLIQAGWVGRLATAWMARQPNGAPCSLAVPEVYSCACSWR